MLNSFSVMGDQIPEVFGSIYDSVPRNKKYKYKVLQYEDRHITVSVPARYEAQL